jgi:hypothetical protein
VTPFHHLTSFIVRVGDAPQGPAVLLDLRSGEARAFASLQACLQELTLRADDYRLDAVGGRTVRGSRGGDPT